MIKYRVFRYSDQFAFRIVFTHFLKCFCLATRFQFRDRRLHHQWAWAYLIRNNFSIVPDTIAGVLKYGQNVTIIDFVSFFQVRSPKSPDISGVATGGGDEVPPWKRKIICEKSGKKRKHREGTFTLPHLTDIWAGYTLLPDIRSSLQLHQHYHSHNIIATPPPLSFLSCYLEEPSPILVTFSLTFWDFVSKDVLYFSHCPQEILWPNWKIFPWEDSNETVTLW